MNNTQKTIKYIALAFAVCLTVFIITTIFDVVVGIIDGISGKDDKAVTASYTYDSITSLDVDMGLGDIVIRCEGNEFVVNANNVWGFEIKENNGKLTIETGSKSLFSDSEDSSLEIIVPKDLTLDKLKAEVGAGTCTIDSISADTTDFDTGAGELICHRLNTKNCKVDSGIGAVTMSFMGNVSLYSIVLDKGIGSAEINGESYNKSKHQNNDAERKIDVDCGIGGIELNFE